MQETTMLVVWSGLLTVFVITDAQHVAVCKKHDHIKI